MKTSTIDSKILTLIGFAQRAGKVVSGDATVNAMIKKGKVELLILANDISDKSKSRWINKAQHEEVPCFVLAEKAYLGQAIGQSPRTVVAILDNTFADSILKYRNEL